MACCGSWGHKELDMHQVQKPVGGADFAVLGDRGLEVVGEHRDVVRIAGRLRFLERGELADGVGPAVVHVVAGQVAAAADLHERGRNLEDVAFGQRKVAARDLLSGRHEVHFPLTRVTYSHYMRQACAEGEML